MQEAALVDLLELDDHITVSTTAGGGDDVLVEGKRDEDDDGDEVDGGADGTHALWDLGLVRLAHVAAAKAGAHEGGPQPADHGVAEGEGEQGEGEAGDEGFAIALEGVCEDGDGCAGEGEEGDELGAGERG